MLAQQRRRPGRVARRRPLLVLAITAGLAQSACGEVRVNPGAESPEALAEEFIGATSRGDHDASWALTSQVARDELGDQERWSACWTAIFDPVEQYDYEILSIDDTSRDTATFVLVEQTATISGEPATTTFVLLTTRRGSGWLFDSVWLSETNVGSCLADLVDRPS